MSGRFHFDDSIVKSHNASSISLSSAACHSSQLTEWLLRQHWTLHNIQPEVSPEERLKLNNLFIKLVISRNCYGPENRKALAEFWGDVLVSVEPSIIFNTMSFLLDTLARFPMPEVPQNNIVLNVLACSSYILAKLWNISGPLLSSALERYLSTWKAFKAHEDVRAECCSAISLIVSVPSEWLKEEQRRAILVWLEPKAGQSELSNLGKIRTAVGLLTNYSSLANKTAGKVLWKLAVDYAVNGQDSVVDALSEMIASLFLNSEGFNEDPGSIEPEFMLKKYIKKFQRSEVSITPVLWGFGKALPACKLSGDEVLRKLVSSICEQVCIPNFLTFHQIDLLSKAILENLDSEIAAKFVLFTFFGERETFYFAESLFRTAFKLSLKVPGCNVCTILFTTQERIELGRLLSLNSTSTFSSLEVDQLFSSIEIVIETILSGIERNEQEFLTVDVYRLCHVFLVLRNAPKYKPSIDSLEKIIDRIAGVLASDVELIDILGSSLHALLCCAAGCDQKLIEPTFDKLVPYMEDSQPLPLAIFFSSYDETRQDAIELINHRLSQFILVDTDNVADLIYAASVAEFPEDGDIAMQIIGLLLDKGIEYFDYKTQSVDEFYRSILNVGSTEKLSSKLFKLLGARKLVISESLAGRLMSNPLVLLNIALDSKAPFLESFAAEKILQTLVDSLLEEDVGVQKLSAKVLGRFAKAGKISAEDLKGQAIGQLVSSTLDLHDRLGYLWLLSELLQLGLFREISSVFGVLWSLKNDKEDVRLHVEIVKVFEDYCALCKQPDDSAIISYVNLSVDESKRAFTSPTLKKGYLRFIGASECIDDLPFILKLTHPLPLQYLTKCLILANDKVSSDGHYWWVRVLQEIQNSNTDGADELLRLLIARCSDCLDLELARNIIDTLCQASLPHKIVHEIVQLSFEEFEKRDSDSLIQFMSDALSSHQPGIITNALIVQECLWFIGSLKKESGTIDNRLIMITLRLALSVVPNGPQRAQIAAFRALYVVISSFISVRDPEVPSQCILENNQSEFMVLLSMGAGHDILEVRTAALPSFFAYAAGVIRNNDLDAFHNSKLGRLLPKVLKPCSAEHVPPVLLYDFEKTLVAEGAKFASLIHPECIQELSQLQHLAGQYLVLELDNFGKSRDVKWNEFIANLVPFVAGLVDEETALRAFLALLCMSVLSSGLISKILSCIKVSKGYFEDQVVTEIRYLLRSKIILSTSEVGLMDTLEIIGILNSRRIISSSDSKSLLLFVLRSKRDRADLLTVLLDFILATESDLMIDDGVNLAFGVLVSLLHLNPSMVRLGKILKTHHVALAQSPEKLDCFIETCLFQGHHELALALLEKASSIDRYTDYLETRLRVMLEENDVTALAVLEILVESNKAKLRSVAVAVLPEVAGIVSNVAQLDADTQKRWLAFLAKLIKHLSELEIRIVLGLLVILQESVEHHTAAQIDGIMKPLAVYL